MFCLMAIILLLTNVVKCSHFSVDSISDGVVDGELINGSTVEKSTLLLFDIFIKDLRLFGLFNFSAVVISW